jgi:hypothetical protein
MSMGKGFIRVLRDLHWHWHLPARLLGTSEL